MAKKITFVDLQGRFRIVTPSYGAQRRSGEQTEAEYLDAVWARLVARGVYSVPADHPHFYIEEADIQTKIDACSGADFRYAGKPDADGIRDGRNGAWEMDSDGTPKVNMAKARGVQMDKIRVMRDKELVKKDVEILKAIEAGDSSAQATVATDKQTLRDIPQTFDLTTDTPVQLKAKWPDGLPTE